MTPPVTEEVKANNPVVLNNVVIGLDAIPTYDGIGSIDEYLAIVEETSLLANWTELQKVAITRLKLRGQAKQFIVAETTLQTTPSWDALARALKKQFRRPEINGEARKQYMECKQRVGETCRQFLTRLKVHANKTFSLTGEKNIDQELQRRFEEDLTTQFIMGLQMPLKAKVLSKNPENLDAALVVAEREEAIESLIKPFGSHRECRGIDRSRTNTEPSKRLKCYNCQGEGHFARECRQTKPQFRCFKYNQAGHFANSCKMQAKRETRICYNCNTVGHLRINCPSRQTSRYEKRRHLNANAATFRPQGQAAEQQGTRH